MSNSSISKGGITEPFNLQVARGQIYKHVHLDKFGFNADIATGAETLWSIGGSYTWPSASTMVISSSSTADTAAGTGARTVTIQGLDADYLEIEETITLAGQTNSTATTATFFRVHRAFVTTAGTGLINAGVVYVHTGGANTSGVPDDLTTVSTVIGANFGQTTQSFYTVPANKTLYITQISASCGAAALNTATLTLRTRTATSATDAWNTKAVRVYGLGAADNGILQVPIKVTEKYDVELRAQMNTSTAAVAGTFTGYLISD